MNESLWLLLAFLDLFMCIILFYFFGKFGLYCVIICNIIICNIQVLKTIELFGLTTTLGNVLYGGIFFATDVLNEIYGKKDAQKGVILGFIALILATGYFQLTLLFIPAGEDFAHKHLVAIFSLLPRVAIASLLAYVISQFHDVWMFSLIKKQTKNKYLWLRNNLSTFLSQIIDSAIFCSVAFLGVFSFNQWLQIFITTCVLKIVFAFIDTPFIYLAVKIANKNNIET